MNLTKSQLLVILKKAYSRGVWEHIHQRTYDNVPNPIIDMAHTIPDSTVEDLIPEEL